MVDDLGDGPDWTKLGTKARKFGIALLGGAVTVAAAGVLPDEFSVWVAAAVAFATALGVYGVKNVD